MVANRNKNNSSTYGLVGTFVVDEFMTIETVRVRRENYDKMLRKSLIHLLIWLQRTVLLSDKGLAIKEKLSQGVVLDYNLNKRLISYYQMRKHILLPISSETLSLQRNKHKISEIIGNEITISSCGNNKYLLFVPIAHVQGEESHRDFIPIFCIDGV